MAEMADNETETKTFNRANVSRSLYSIFETVERELANRQVKTSFLEFSEFIASKVDKSALAGEFIENQTPLEYRIIESLKNPEKRREFEKFMKKL